MSGPGWRSPLLGETKALELAEGAIEYFERGRGPTLVFVHGWLVNANLWRNVVDGLHDDFRCLTLDLPLGSHRVTMPRGADLGPDGIAALIASALERLELIDVTLVGNDSGGAYSQIAVARHTDRVVRLVLTSCETPYDRWPPAQFEHLRIAARDPELLRQAAEALRDPAFRRSAYGAAAGIAKHSVVDEVVDSYALPGCFDPDVLRDAAVVMSSASTAAIRSAGRRLIDGPPVPILLAWPREDMLFPLAHAERYAQALPAGTLALIEDSYSFTPEDQPTLLAEEIRRFARAA
ncbi:MAG: alpha/beta hydrolase [Deltaproteobacteria bacterium]|nr:MAG: alpha/beta hydrolase [Deltaproteobacteria bacterium]TMB23184.1 MAG: alpha/beta hydrolase [Deltaproteobacteria bacterium]